MKKFTVTGYNYGIDQDGSIQWFEVGETYQEISVKSQGGWETGCRDYNHNTLYNVKCVSGEKGSPHCCGEWTFQEEEKIMTREELETRALELFSNADAHERACGFPVFNLETQSVSLWHQNNHLPDGWTHCRATNPRRNVS